MTMRLNISAQGSSSSGSAVNKCFSFHDVDSTWEEARVSCLKMGAHLATLETTEEWEKVKSLIAGHVKMSGSFTHWYIGLRKESGTWKWTEAGSPGVVVAADDDRWQPIQPSVGSPEENCGEINAEYPPGVYGHFNNVRCNVKYQATITTGDGKPFPPRGYICES